MIARLGPVTVSVCQFWTTQSLWMIQTMMKMSRLMSQMTIFRTRLNQWTMTTSLHNQTSSPDPASNLCFLTTLVTRLLPGSSSGRSLGTDMDNLDLNSSPELLTT